MRVIILSIVFILTGCFSTKKAVQFSDWDDLDIEISIDSICIDKLEVNNVGIKLHVKNKLGKTVILNRDDFYFSLYSMENKLVKWGGDELVIPNIYIIDDRSMKKMYFYTTIFMLNNIPNIGIIRLHFINGKRNNDVSIIYEIC